MFEKFENKKPIKTIEGFLNHESNLLEEKEITFPENKREAFKNIKKAFLAITAGTMLLNTAACARFLGFLSMYGGQGEVHNHGYEGKFEERDIRKQWGKGNVILRIYYLNDHKHDKEIEEISKKLKDDGWGEAVFSRYPLDSRFINCDMDEEGAFNVVTIDKSLTKVSFSDLPAIIKEITLKLRSG